MRIGRLGRRAATNRRAGECWLCSAGHGRSFADGFYGAAQWRQHDAAFAVVGESPMEGALVTQPKVLYVALPLACPNEWRRHGFSRLDDTISFDEKQFAIAQTKKGFGTLGIGATA